VFLLKIALIGILCGLVLLLGPSGALFWPGAACIAAGGVALLMAVRAAIRRQPEDEIAVESPVPGDEDDITDEGLAPLQEAAPDRPAPDLVAIDRRYLGMEIALKVILAIGTVVLLVLKLFVWSPEAIERRKQEEKQRELEKQLVRDALAGKTGPALQFLVTGDRSLLRSAKKKEPERPAAGGRDRRQVLEVLDPKRKGAGAPRVKASGDPRPASPPP
jgi:hypothetical protein